MQFVFVLVFYEDIISLHFFPREKRVIFKKVRSHGDHTLKSHHVHQPAHDKKFLLKKVEIVSLDSCPLTVDRPQKDFP